VREFEAPDWKLLYSSLARRRRFAFCPVGYYLYHVPGRDGYAEHADSWRYGLYCAKHALPWTSFLKMLFRQGIRDFYRPGRNFRRGKLEDFLRRSFEHKFALLESRAFEDDPKVVPAVIELEERIFNSQKFYERMLWELHELTGKFLNSDLYGELTRIPWLDFYCEEPMWSWQLGGVIFNQMPELVWKFGNTLQILDMNSYLWDQERSRATTLSKVYCWRFMRIPPEAVQVNFYDPASGVVIRDETPGEDFTELFDIFMQEAAMWRDYLVSQQQAAQLGQWNFMNQNNCGKCRFRKLCPALTGTPEPAE